MILSILMSKSPDVSTENVNFVCDWFRTNLSSNDEKHCANAVLALQKFLLREEFRVPFSEKGGLDLLSNLLLTKTKQMQLLYQIINCIWLLSFNDKVAEKIGDTRIISSLIDIIKIGYKEKIIRMAFATLVNCLDKKNNNQFMIDADLMRPLEDYSQKQFADEDLVEDIKTLYEELSKSVVTLSTFDVYKKEINSGKLYWSPVHTSEKFWKENGHHFEENNYDLLLKLKNLLNTSTDPVVLSVAAFDVGEFARLHPRGRIIIKQLDLKIALMKLMEHKDNEVKKNSLLAIQKLMVQNWEFLKS